MTVGGEEAAEMIATIRGEHVIMKQWFMGDSPEARALRQKWGDYPGLWKEVLNWKGWKEARRGYLAHSQKSESSASNSNSAPSSAAESLPRKRKSRWGSVNEDQQDQHQQDSQGHQPRKSRWAPAPAPPPQQSHYQQQQQQPMPSRSQPSLPGLPGLPANLPPQQRQEMQQYQTRLRQVNERLETVDRDAERVDQLPRGHRERSQSPPPVYGPDGKRKNTRAVRWRDRLTQERQDLLEKLMNLNPATRHNSLFRRKRTQKVPIPIAQHPTYNFIGLIIGPRGKTQKELEAKTGCKIAIRGKGSVKEGARGRRDGKMMEGDDEPLHVVITGEDQRSVDAATDMIQQMLVVIDDEKNVHKQAQLRELALLNGTLKEEEFCQICAEKGHRAFECPKRFSAKANKTVVKCAICGDTSHPTRDCTQKAEPKATSKELDSDYANFMAELDGKKVEAPPKKVTDEAPAEPAGLTILKPANAVAAPPGTVLPPPPTGLPPLPPGGLPPPPPATGLPPILPPPPPPQVAPGMPPPGVPPPVIPPPGIPPPGIPPPGVPPPGVPPPGVPPPGIPLPPLPGAPSHLPTAAAAYGGYPPQATPGYDQEYGYNQQQQEQFNGTAYQQGYPQQQQPQAAAPEDETAGWDYRSYYNQGGNNNNAAGGFNWWEQN